MSMTIKATLWCDICSDWTNFLVFNKYNRASIQKVRKVAKKSNWTTKFKEGETIDICPKCSGEQK